MGRCGVTMGRPEYILVNSEKPRDAAMQHGTGFVALSHHNLFIIAFTNLMVYKVFHGVKAVRCYCAYRVLYGLPFLEIGGLQFSYPSYLRNK